MCLLLYGPRRLLSLKDRFPIGLMKGTFTGIVFPLRMRYWGVQWQMRALSFFSYLFSLVLNEMTMLPCHRNASCIPSWKEQDVADAHRFFQPAAGPGRPAPQPITKGPAACSDWLTKQMPPVAQNMSVNARGHSWHACLFIWKGFKGVHAFVCEPNDWILLFTQLVALATVCVAAPLRALWLVGLDCFVFYTIGVDDQFSVLQHGAGSRKNILLFGNGWNTDK